MIRREAGPALSAATSPLWERRRHRHLPVRDSAASHLKRSHLRAGAWAIYAFRVYPGWVSGMERAEGRGHGQ